MEGSMDLFATTDDVIEEIKTALKRKRLELNLSQSTLAERSGVSLGTIKRFEKSGKISLQSLLKLTYVLGYFSEISALFMTDNIDTLEQWKEYGSRKGKERKRGRK